MQRKYAVLVALAAIVAGAAFLPLGGTALGSLSLLGWGRWLYNLAGTAKFVHVAPDVYRLDLWWRPLPVVLLPLTAVLVRDGSRWVLIDAGAPDNWSQGYASHLAAAVKRTLPRKAPLDAILLTHAHMDHTGALPKLLRAHPSARVVLHEGEAPFLEGRHSYLPPGSPVVRLAQAVGLAPAKPPQVDPSRVHHLRGSSGSLSDLGISGLAWVGTPGHTPGHVSYLHSPSGTLIAGDAIMNLWPSFTVSGGLGTILSYPLRKLGAGGALLSGAAGRGVLRLLPPAVADSLPAPLLRMLTGGLLGGGEGAGAPGEARTERVVSGGASVVAGGGDETSEGTVVQGGGLHGQPAGEVKVPYTVGLPKLQIQAKPMFICPHPRCDKHQAHRSLCHLATLDFKLAIPMHDMASKGISRQDLAAFAASLPACR